LKHQILESPEEHQEHTKMAEFEERFREYRELARGFTNNKNTFCLHAIHGDLNIDVIYENTEHVQRKSGDADFKMVPLIRFLYLMDRHLKSGSADVSKNAEIVNCMEHIENAMMNFPFWPHTGTPYPDSIVFWSENHIFMLLSSAHLFRRHIFNRQCDLWQERRERESAGDLNATECDCLDERRKRLSSSMFVSDLEERLLTVYLKAHVRMGGMYEVLSHTYLPYSLSAMMNLVDFSPNREIRDLAQRVSNIIVRQLLLCTTDEGYGGFTASARAYARYRLKPHSVNVNQLLWVLTGKGPDLPAAYSLTNHLATTDWRPDPECLQALNHNGFWSGVMNHPLTETRSHYPGINVDEAAPFYWSAGLITHPEFVRETRAYQNRKQLKHNVHLWALAFVPEGFASSLMNKYAYLSAGQRFTDVRLNVYKKERGLCMTSFEKFLGGCCGFQQMPWMVNIAGCAVFSQSGAGSEGVLGFKMTNTHSPWVTQREDTLMAVYSTPSALRSTLLVGNLLSSKVRFFWPRDAFDECLEFTSSEEIHEYVKNAKNSDSSKPLPIAGLAERKLYASRKSAKNAWWIGRRKHCYIGVICDSVTRTNKEHTKDSRLELKDSPEMYYVRRECTETTSVWVVKVGTTDAYARLSDFAAACMHTTIRTAKQRRSELPPDLQDFHAGDGGSNEDLSIDTANDLSEAFSEGICLSDSESEHVSVGRGSAKENTGGPVEAVEGKSSSVRSSASCPVEPIGSSTKGYSVRSSASCPVEPIGIKSPPHPESKSKPKKAHSWWNYMIGDGPAGVRANVDSPTSDGNVCLEMIVPFV
jgi:hypothetical protein